MTRAAAIWVFVALQALVPIGIFGLRETNAALAPHVVLAVQPVDPRDPFRGQYAEIRYALRIPAPPGAMDGATVYVPLHRAGDTWTGGYAVTEKPHGTFIRGRVAYGMVDFGTARAYASEAEAQRLDAALISRRVYAEVALGRDGEPMLRKIIVR